MAVIVLFYEIKTSATKLMKISLKNRKYFIHILSNCKFHFNSYNLKRIHDAVCSEKSDIFRLL